MRAAFLILLLSCTLARAGYTQYWTWKEKPDDKALKACIQEMRLIISARTNILANPDGNAGSTAIITETNVDLNGIGELSHEPFVFPGEPGFNFCKTAGKPYDAVVTACLMVARDHFPIKTLEIDSDGDWNSGDWNDGANLYASVLNRAANNPMVSWDILIGLLHRLWLPLIILIPLGIWAYRYYKKRTAD
jgi:hypothetical protein